MLSPRKLREQADRRSTIENTHRVFAGRVGIESPLQLARRVLTMCPHPDCGREGPKDRLAEHLLFDHHEDTETGQCVRLV